MSRLTQIELINFMSLPHAVLEFDEQGIISPVGYNDSGKSAVTRSLEVLWFDAYPQAQVKFITDGQPSFVIKNYFDDGVLIQHTKYANGQSYWLMQQGDKVIYTNKLPSGTYAATKGVPDAISSYLGVIQDVATGEVLNVRRNTDKLLLVATTGGENYKIFNNICQGDRLAYAVGEVNKDLNTGNRELSSDMSRLQGKKEVLSKMTVFSEETEKYITKLSTELNQKADRLFKLATMAQTFEAYSGKKVISSLPLVNLTQLRVLQSIRTCYQAQSGRVIDQIPLVDVSKFRKLTQIKSQLSSLGIKIAPEVPIVDINRLKRLQRLVELNGELTKAQAKLDEDKAKYQQEVDTLHELAVQNHFKVCPHCGRALET